MIDNLPGLRDIHLPESGVPFFPIANGWWILLLISVGGWGAYYLGKKIWLASARIYTRRILLSLKDDVELPAAIKMSEILRRACVRKYPEAVSLSGDAWIAFLNQKSKYNLEKNAAELLKAAPFVAPESKIVRSGDMRNLWQFCYDWVGDNL